MLKILASIHTLPTDKSATTMFFENLLPVLRKRTKVQIIWIVYQPDRLNQIGPKDENSIVLDIHDFNNAVDIISKTKPDLVYAGATHDLMDCSFSSAAKFCKIPVLSEFYSIKPMPRTQSNMIKNYITRFFSKTVPTDTVQTKKRFMRRGRFYLYKFLFLLKTLNATRMNIVKIFLFCSLLFQRNITDYKPIYDSRFTNTAHWLESENLLNPLLSAGFPKDSLYVTGSPIFDNTFREIKNWDSPNNDKTKVLLITTSLYEHGFWTKEQRDNIVKIIIKEFLNHKNEFNLVVKIHPTSEILDEYKSLIFPIDPSIEIFQEGYILEYLKSADVILTFASGNASATIYSLIARKPIIICNFYDLTYDLFLDRNLAIECKNQNEIIPSIHKAIKSNPATEEKINQYIKEFLYSDDGKASERISDLIINLVNKNKIN